MVLFIGHPLPVSAAYDLQKTLKLHNFIPKSSFKDYMIVEK